MNKLAGFRWSDVAYTEYKVQPGAPYLAPDYNDPQALCGEATVRANDMVIEQMRQQLADLRADAKRHAFKYTNLRRRMREIKGRRKP